MAGLGKYLTLCLVVFLICSLMLVKPTNALAKTIVVPTDYPTIQQAIDSANNGDTILVKKGYYPETLIVNKSISIVGEDRNLTIIDGQKKL